MAIYQRFEDLPVWQEAARLYNSALDLLQSQKLLLGPGWRFQVERAALSVSNNIAEGFERLTPNELRNFLVIARGSAGEIRSMVGVIVRRREMQPHVSQLQAIRTTAESCARQLGAWLQTIDSPKQSRKPARLRNSVHDRTVD
jgi:four helix bundle protein